MPPSIFFDEKGLIVCTFSNALLKYTLNLKHDTFFDTLDLVSNITKKYKAKNEN